MKIDANKELLIKKLDKIIAKLGKRKDDDKIKTTFVVTYGAFISGLTTVLIGLSSYLSTYATYFSIAALITSASVTVVQAWDKLFNHKRLWIIQAEALNSFREIREDISHLEENNKLGQSEINECYELYKQAQRKWNLDWKELRVAE